MKLRFTAIILLFTLAISVQPENTMAASNRFFDFSSGRTTIGFFTSFADDFTYYFGQVRTKPAGTFEVGFKGGLADIDLAGLNTSGAYLGVDGNFLLARFEESFPFDLFLTSGLSTVLKSSRALNEFFIGTAGEKVLSSSSVLGISGNLGAEIALSGGSLVRDDEFDAFVTAGITFNIGDNANILLEIKGGSDLAAGIGINFEL